MTTSNNPVASTSEIRSRFPALERKHNGFPVAYFDGPGGTQVPRAVAEAMRDYLFHHNANTHWDYPTSAETDALIAGIRTVRMLPETGQLDWDDLAGAINRNTKLLAIGAASNALGTINDVQYAARLAHEVGALVYVDAVHYAPHSLARRCARPGMRLSGLFGL
jgi:selenocysteine lyase/cysteine desulfurase